MAKLRLVQIYDRMIIGGVVAGATVARKDHVMDVLLQDLRLAIRQFVKRPGFTIVAVVTLALAIGANTAVFSVINGVLLRPLPYPAPEHYTHIGWQSSEGGVSDWATALQFEYLREQSQVFDGVATYSPIVAGLGEAEENAVLGLQVTADYFAVLGFRPALGRTFTENDFRADGRNVAILSHNLWRSDFAADPDVVDSTVRLDGQSYTIVGVMPAQFRFPERPDYANVFVPFTLEADPRDSRQDYQVVGRLEADVTPVQIEADLSAVAAGLRTNYPDHGLGDIVLRDFTDKAVSGGFRQMLWVLLGAVVLVLLIGCANVANLLLVHAARRRREIAVRAALGAGRGRIVRQLLTESVVLGLLGGSIGVGLGFWGVEALLALSPQPIPRADAIGLDLTVLGFTTLIAVATGMVSGLAAALPTARTGLISALRAGAQTGGRSARRVHSVLIAAEGAFSLVLLAGAGLLITSFLQLSSNDPGFETDDVLTVRFSDMPDGYDTEGQVGAFERSVLERIRALPGVDLATVASNIPLGDPTNFPVTIEGRPDATENAVEWRGVNHDYFRTLQIAVVRGRQFTAADMAGAPVAMVNSSFARHYFGEENPIGRRLLLGQFGERRVPNFEDPPRRIIGIVDDIREMALDLPPKRTVYTPLAQSPAMLVNNTTPKFMIRGASVERLIPAVRSIISTVEPRMPEPRFRMLGDFVGGGLDTERFNAVLTSVFAALALMLTGVGIYGTVAHTVRQRTHEIGIRVTLGANTREIATMVLRQSLGVITIGVVVGLVAAVFVTRGLRSLLYGIEPGDPLTLTAVALLLLGVAALASVLPARRAARVDPVDALRDE